MLDVKAQSEEHCEDCVHLACEQEEGRVPDCSVYCGPEFVLRLREQEEVEVLDEMDKDDSGDGDTSEDVCNVDSCVRFQGWCVCHII